MAASTGSKMGSSSVTNYNNHFVGWVRERGKRRRRRNVETAVGRIDRRIYEPASNRSDVVVNIFTGSLTSRRETTTFVPFPPCFLAVSSFPKSHDFSFFRSTVRNSRP
jgi:hypothetical protein